MYRVSIIKKESPNEGTETRLFRLYCISSYPIKKESPNEGTETYEPIANQFTESNKKRIPE